MRRPLVWLLFLVLALASRHALTADEPQEPFPPPRFTTTTQGTVPDLSGRWLVVGYLVVQGSPGGGVPISIAWEVTTVDGKPHVEVRWGGLPPAIKASYDEAVAKQAPWEPSPQQLEELRDSWDTLTFDRPPVSTVETTLSGKDAPSDLVKTEPTMQDTLFVVSHVITFTPGPQRPTKDVMLFGATEALPDGYRGKYAGVTIANAPFPIPVAFKGTFRAHRLGPVQQPGLLARLLSIFKGCGREKPS